jgi:cardiolipin synthase
MSKLDRAVARIALELHRNRIDAICAGLSNLKDGKLRTAISAGLGPDGPPELLEQIGDALEENPRLTAAELELMLRVSCETARLATGGTSLQLVWTGPSTGLVPIRHTEQVLVGLIDSAVERLFLVSFVAYEVKSVMNALKRAVGRGVRIRVLLEQSKAHGGAVSTDSLEMMKVQIPQVDLFVRDQAARDDAEAGGSVHAKCAVADGKTAFVTSANLTAAAMDRNMELGVLIDGGPVPEQLEQHLDALVNTKHLKRV